MAKKVVRLTEADLHNVITKSLKRILREFDLDDFELPKDWFRTDAKRDAIHDIGIDPESLERKKEIPTGPGTFYVRPDIEYPLYNNDGEEITDNDIAVLRGDSKYNNEKRRENAKNPIRPRKKKQIVNY